LSVRGHGFTYRLAVADADSAGMAGLSEKKGEGVFCQSGKVAQALSRC
jgi:hypothetical protein